MKKSYVLFFIVLTLSVITLRHSNALKTPPSSHNQIQLSFAPIVKKASPSVVNIYTQKRVTQTMRTRSPFFGFSNDPFFQEFFGRSLGRQFTKERMENSLGSGVILHKQGYVVTSNHVIEGAEQIKIILHDGIEFEADLVLKEKRTDLAVLKIKTDNNMTFPALPLGDSESLEVGDIVLAIGNPFGVGQTVTSGIVSANARANLGISDLSYFIQTDAAINPGNSGGALVGLSGELIGINTAIFSKTGGSLGIGFAIPSSMVQTVLNAALKDGIIRRPWFGAKTQDITSDMMESLGLKAPKGALINSVTQNSPADDAGLKTGDIITHINKYEIWDSISLKFRIATLPLGEEAKITFLRNGALKQTAFSPISAPEKPKRNITQLQGKHPLNKITVSNINPALIEEMGLENIDDENDKVIVIKTSRKSYARRLGIKQGDIITHINNEKINNVTTLKDILSKQRKGWQITLKRDNQVLTLSVL